MRICWEVARVDVFLSMIYSIDESYHLTVAFAIVRRTIALDHVELFDES